MKGLTMKRIVILAVASLGTVAAWGQVQTQPGVVLGNPTPGGACNPGAGQIVTSTGTIYTCQAGLWSTSAGASFPGVASGGNGLLNVGAGTFNTTLGQCTAQAANYNFCTESPTAFRAATFSDVTVNGVVIGTNSADMNLNGTTPAAPVGSTNVTFNCTGTNCSAYVLAPIPAITPGSGQPLSDFLCAKGNDITVGSATITAFTISGTTATITATTPQTNQYLVGETFKTTGTTPSSMDGRVTITSVSSTQIVGTTLDSQSGSYTSGGTAYHVCGNATDAISATPQTFATTLAIPTPTGYPLEYAIRLLSQQWTTATAPTLNLPSVLWNGQAISTWQNAGTLRNSSAGVQGGEAFSIYLPYSGWVMSASGWNDYGASSANSSANSAQTTSAGATLTFKTSFNPTGLASGTYTSGGSITGTVGQTCTLSSFATSTNTGGTATVALTGTNVIAGGTALVITNTGFGSGGVATTATLGSGTATCSGTATVVTVLGGAQGNAIRLLVAKAEQK